MPKVKVIKAVLLNFIHLAGYGLTSAPLCLRGRAKS